MKEFLRDITVYSKYANYLPNKKRRQTFNEIVDTYKNMMVEQVNLKVQREKDRQELLDLIDNNIGYIHDSYVLPSMRALQFAGKPIFKNNAKIYNCVFVPVEDTRCFGEFMFLLLGGTGVGFSVQDIHTSKLPSIRKNSKKINQKFLVSDTIEGWGYAVNAIIDYYFGKTDVYPEYSYIDVRKKGERLTSGGSAPGHEPLELALKNIEKVFKKAISQGYSRLRNIDLYDIVCHIADSVLAGGIRRAALICLFDFSDNLMARSKVGNFYKTEPQRARSNNSGIKERKTITKEEFFNLFNEVEKSGTGEPGIYLSNDITWGTNPCVETALRPYQFCNLTTINFTKAVDQETFNKCCIASSLFGTLQATFTDFHFLRPIYKKNTEQDALLGNSITGLARDSDIDFKQGANLITLYNAKFSGMLNINRASRTTCVKPEGTTSCVLGTSSGIHAWHSKYYIRRMQFKADDPIVSYMKKHLPELIEVYESEKAKGTHVISVPMKSPEGALLREDEDPIKLLNRVKHITENWIFPGHVYGINTHNCSVTVSIKDNNPEEWKRVGNWMWENKDYYNGISVFPFSGGIFKQTPFEEIDEETYNKLYNILKERSWDLTSIIEEEDNTEVSDTIACGGGSCELI